MARQYEIPIVVLSQLNRQNERPYLAPQLVELRDSGVIEDVADLIIFINRLECDGIRYHKNGISTKGLAQINVAKNRHGALVDFELKFDADCCRFRDLAESEESFSGNSSFDYPPFESDTL